MRNKDILLYLSLTTFITLIAFTFVSYPFNKSMGQTSFFTPSKESHHFIKKTAFENIPIKQFSSPNGISVDPAGNVYVVDAGNYRIQKFDSKGIFITKWGTSGTADGQFSSPNGISVDPAGNVYVVDAGNYRIQKFDSKGTLV
jgi:DNA-binding beta-propeller fold protein YncE